MGLNARHAAVCSAMKGKKIEEHYNVPIIDRRGRNRFNHIFNRTG
ncbi:hypothetical protein SAMN02194393_05177 [Maledivibacter halophilus]|uniref:Uncharacterized protein n=1 Tax=Maledivibacter halophilus TaxID=36842 RepID=A0A1T5MQK5_9FIRM|nr:hypothetical protein SAMN02194393_05177 [Maledivibacter halophilus]